MTATERTNPKPDAGRLRMKIVLGHRARSGLNTSRLPISCECRCCAAALRLPIPAEYVALVR